MLSALNLVSLSSKSLVGLFGSMFIGAQVTFTVVLSGLSVPKTTLSATPTREVALLPTKCVLSTGSILFPRICVAIGLTAVVSASLLCILRAKGFSSSSRAQKQNDVSSQPPSPPPEPSSSSSAVKTPRRIRWMLFLMIALLVLLTIAASVAACVYFAYSVPPAVQELASFCSDKLSATETRFWDVFSAAWSYAAAIAAYICALGMPDLKIFSIALAAHLFYLFIFTTVRRLLRRLGWFAQADPRRPLAICLLLVPMIVVASVPQLRRITWVRWYYDLYLEGYLPSVREINWHMLCLSSYLSSVASTYFVETTIFIGISVIHASVAWLASVILFIRSMPFVFWTLVQELSHRPESTEFLLFCFGLTTIICLEAPTSQYMKLLPWARQVVRKALYCQESRRKAKEIFWYLIRKYQAWKVEQIEEFSALAAATPNTLWAKVKSCFEIWCDLHSGHKLLIAGPALAFYGYFYIFPDSYPLCAVHSDDLLQDGDNDDTLPFNFSSFSFPPEPPVENRFAAMDKPA